MSNLSEIGYWKQDPYIRECLVWRSVTLKSEFSGGDDDYGDYLQCTDPNDPEEMADRLYVMQTTLYKDRLGVVRRMVGVEPEP